MIDAKTAISRYLAKYDLFQKQFADFAGISDVSVNKYLHGAPISARSAQKIEDATKGEIKFEELTDKPRPTNYRQRIARRQKNLE